MVLIISLPNSNRCNIFVDVKNSHDNNLAILDAIYLQEKEVVAASVEVIYVGSLQLVVGVIALSVAEVALGTGVYGPQISAVATSQVLPSELTHHVTLMTTNNHRT